MDFKLVLDRFFAPVGSDVLLTTDLYKGEYNLLLVILSVAIAVTCAFIALSAVGRSRIVSRPVPRNAWMVIGSFTMGLGVWSMHFIGMLSFELPCVVEYDPVITFVSMLPSIIASLIALSFIHQRRATAPGLRLLGGVLMASGIAAMHYIGMASMRMDALLYYDGARVALSVVVAVSLAWISLSLPSYLLGDVGARFFGKLAEYGIGRATAVRGMSAIGLGLAVTGMHYTAMWAALFVPQQGVLAASNTWDPAFLALWIMLGVALMATAVVSVVSASTQRMHARKLQVEVAQRQRVEAAVEDQRSRLQAIIDNVVDGIITINASGVIQHWSPAAKALFGYTEDEVSGQSVAMLMDEPFSVAEIGQSDSDGTIVPREIEQFLGVGREATGLRKDGSTFPLDLSIGYGEVGGKPFYTGVARDLTLRKRELDILEKARDRAQQAVKAKSEFLANMSHEIRTPMNGVLGFIGLALEENDLHDDVRRYLNTAQKSAKNLLVIIDAILDFSRLESGGITLESVPMDLRQLSNETVHHLSPMAQEKSLAMSVEYADDLPHTVIGDPTRIRQILINLVGNAIKFTEKGSIRVYVSRHKPDSDLIRFAVADTGIGMSAETMDRVFKPFEQADSSIHRVYGGTGLGTTISLQLAELHGGELWAESEEGKGSTFYFTARLAEIAQTDPLETSGQEPAQTVISENIVTEPTEPADARPVSFTPPSGADRETLRRMFDDLFLALDEDNPDPVRRVLDELNGVLDHEFVDQMRRSISQFDFGRAREKADMMLDDLHLR